MKILILLLISINSYAGFDVHEDPVIKKVNSSFGIEIENALANQKISHHEQSDSSDFFSQDRNANLREFSFKILGTKNLVRLNEYALELLGGVGFIYGRETGQDDYISYKTKEASSGKVGTVGARIKAGIVKVPFYFLQPVFGVKLSLIDFNNNLEYSKLDGSRRVRIDYEFKDFEKEFDVGFRLIDQPEKTFFDLSIAYVIHSIDSFTMSGSANETAVALTNINSSTRDDLRIQINYGVLFNLPLD